MSGGWANSERLYREDGEPGMITMPAVPVAPERPEPRPPRPNEKCIEAGKLPPGIMMLAAAIRGERQQPDGEFCTEDQACPRHSVDPVKGVAPVAGADPTAWTNEKGKPVHVLPRPNDDRLDATFHEVPRWMR